jgi:hypothetical protein
MKLDWMFPVQRVLAAPDGAGAGGDGGAGSPDGGASEPVGDGGDGIDPQSGLAPGGGDEDDDDDPIVGDDERYTRDPVFSKMRKRLTKLAKADRANREYRAALKAHGVEDPTSVGDLVRRAKQYDEMDALFRNNPEMRKFITPPDQREPEPEPAPAAWSPESYPFDPAAPGADWMMGLDRRGHEQDLRLKRIEKLLEGHQRQTKERELAETRQQHGQVVQAWKSKTDGFIKERGIPANVQGIFRDAVYGAFNELRLRGRAPTAAHIDRILAEYGKAFPGTARSAVTPQAASATRMANSNTNLPRGGHGGTPAPSQRAKLNVAQLGAQLRKQARY